MMERRRNWQLPVVVVALLVCAGLLGYGLLGQRVAVKERQAGGQLVARETGGLDLVDKATRHLITTDNARPETQPKVAPPAPSAPTTTASPTGQSAPECPT